MALGPAVAPSVKVNCPNSELRVPFSQTHGELRKAEKIPMATTFHESDEEVEVSPDDLFGLSNLSKVSQPSTSTSSSSQVLNVSNPAPNVLVDPTGREGGGQILIPSSSTQINVNLNYGELHAPVLGPKNPWDERALEKMNTLTGKF
jgi:pre-mRNA-processing factor 17